MITAAEEVLARRRRDNISFRQAATMIAVERVADLEVIGSPAGERRA